MLTLQYVDFIQFLRIDDNLEAVSLFDNIKGRKNVKRKSIDTKVLILYILNSIPSIPKTEKMKFSFSLYDEEDSRAITVNELKKILQANYFAATVQEVENKANLILQQVVSSG